MIHQQWLQIAKFKSWREKSCLIIQCKGQNEQRVGNGDMTDLLLRLLQCQAWRVCGVSLLKSRRHFSLQTEASRQDAAQRIRPRRARALFSVLQCTAPRGKGSGHMICLLTTLLVSWPGKAWHYFLLGVGTSPTPENPQPSQGDVGEKWLPDGLCEMEVL